jgi:hypothetical protein
MQLRLMRQRWLQPISLCRTFWLDTPDGTRKLYASALKSWVLYIDEQRAQGRDVDYCVHPHSKVRYSREASLLVPSW